MWNSLKFRLKTLATVLDYLIFLGTCAVFHNCFYFTCWPSPGGWGCLEFTWFPEHSKKEASCAHWVWPLDSYMPSPLCSAFSIYYCWTVSHSTVVISCKWWSKTEVWFSCFTGPSHPSTRRHTGTASPSWVPAISFIKLGKMTRVCRVFNVSLAALQYPNIFMWNCYYCCVYVTVYNLGRSLALNQKALQNRGRQEKFSKW